MVPSQKSFWGTSLPTGCTHREAIIRAQYWPKRTFEAKTAVLFLQLETSCQVLKPSITVTLILAELDDNVAFARAKVKPPPCQEDQEGRGPGRSDGPKEVLSALPQPQDQVSGLVDDLTQHRHGATVSAGVRRANTRRAGFGLRPCFGLSLKKQANRHGDQPGK